MQATPSQPQSQPQPQPYPQDTGSPAPADDLSAIAWIHIELRRTLEASHKSLRRYKREADAIGSSDLDSADPAPLSAARQQLHQAAGALDMLCQPALAQVVRASEVAVQRIIARPALLDAKALEAIERSGFALLDYLTRQLAGKPVSPVMLFPQYRAVQQLAGADRVHPADLSPQGWQWRPLPVDRSAHPRAADDDARTEMEHLLLALMRQPDGSSLAHMSDFCADLAAGAVQGAGAADGHANDESAGRLATFWQLAAAMFEAQAGGLLKSDLYVKRVASRLLAQLRSGASRKQEPSDRLAQDLLFFCQNATAPTLEHPAPRLTAVRSAWPEQGASKAGAVVDYEAVSLGRFDPSVLVLARKRLASAKDVWSAVAGGELHRLSTLSEAFALVEESVTRIFPQGQALGVALAEAANQTAAAEAEPAPSLAMEVATALLYLDASLEDGDFDHPELPARLARLAQRIHEVTAGADPQPLEVWMEELYRRVSDRQTMGSVVQELRASLSEVEKHIDQFFRQPESRQDLVPVPQQLTAMRGVLSVLGMSQASQAVLHMRDDVDALLRTDAAAANDAAPAHGLPAGEVERLADNLGSLSFLIDMLSVQPQLAKSLFKFDAVTGKLSAVMGHVGHMVHSGMAAAAPKPAAPTAGDASAGSQTAPSGLADVVDVADLADVVDAAAGATAATTAKALADSAPDRSLAEQVQSLARSLAPAAADGEPAHSSLDAAAPSTLSEAELAQQLERLSQLAVAADERELAHTLSSAKRALASAADASVRDALRADLARGLLALQAAAQPPAVADALMPRPTIAVSQNSLEDDPEMREIFIEEAREVLTEAASAVDRLATDSHEAAASMTQLRRAFHTLKGSGRMVGLRAFGEAAWACEQLFNARLAEQTVAMDAPLQRFTVDALAHLSQWTEAIAEGKAEGYSPAMLTAAALALRDGTLPVAPEKAPVETGARAEAGAQPPTAAALDFPEVTDVVEFGEVAEVAEVGDVVEVLEVPELPEVFDAIDSTDAVVEEDALSWPEAFPALPANAEVLPFDLKLDDADSASAALEGREGREGQEVQEIHEPEERDSAQAHEDTDDHAALSPAADLTSRVPDLPSASDLDLGAPSKLHEAELNFEFDFDQPGEPASAAPMLMTTELPDHAPADSERMPLAGTAELPEQASTIRDSVFGLELDLAELDVPADAEAAPLDTTPPLLLSDLPAVQSLVLDDDFELGSTEEAAPQAEDEPVKVIGHLRIGIPLFNIYLNEADELSRRLGVELAEWVLESDYRPMADSTIALAHSLAGNSATVGYTDLSALGRALEHALMRAQLCGRGREGEGELFIDSADEIRRLLHQFAAGFLRPVSAELMERLADHERWPVPQAPASAEAGDSVAGELEDHIDAELFPFFAEEAEELLPQLQGKLRDWAERPHDVNSPADCMRTLHTFKGGARLAGAMRLGEMAHQLEAAIENLIASPSVSKQQVDPLLGQADAMSVAFAAMTEAKQPTQVAAADAASAAVAVATALLKESSEVASDQASDQVSDATSESSFAPSSEPGSEPVFESADEGFAGSTIESVDESTDETTDQPKDELTDETTDQPTDEPTEESVVELIDEPLNESDPEPASKPGLQTTLSDVPQQPLEAPTPAAIATTPVVDWGRFQRPLSATASLPTQAERASNTAGTGAVRVRAGLLDRLVNQAGEVSITRARIDADVRTMQGSLQELTESLERMRRQLRDIELQAETQISSRLEAAKAQSQAFDPLEMDRFTRFQELTRFMAESVNDVATVQRSLQRTLQSTEDELAAQARLTRELQEDLLRTRMVEFESMADRLYRTVRQAAKESGKQARLEIIGGAIEVDRGVLERMTGSFEHLLRNSVAHGVESAEQRRAAAKPVEGQLTIQVAQAGNEVAIEFSDDGAGLDLPRIRERALERGLLTADQPVTDDELAQFIFASGFSTVTAVTELAGRGIGMDVVRAEVNAMGGRIEINSQPGLGTHLRLLLPLTTAVTQVVMLRCGLTKVAVPSTLVEVVRRVAVAEIDGAYGSGSYDFADESVPFFWLPALLNDPVSEESRSRSQAVVIVRSASQRVALHVDEVLGNQEVVVKNVGPQLARLPGLTGVTLLPSGAVSLIYNPVGLAAVYGEAARLQMRQQTQNAEEGSSAADRAAQPRRAPMVMVVDDSLTVRRVTQRLLVREGYRVVLAKDGMDALEKLAEERPAVLLSDIEMPRMDGFDLLRNVRADSRLAGLPVVMITSRIAQKHRDYAAELGVDHYLGKPYSEELLLSLVAGYCGADAQLAERTPVGGLH